MENARKKRIMIIEDSETLLHLLVRLFKHEHDTLALTDGTDIEGKCADFQPDIILLDIMLPGDHDGLGLIRLIKGNPLYEHIPIIFISALASGEIVLNALKLGANDYLVKPFDLRQLQVKVNNLLNIFCQVKQKALYDQHIPEELAIENCRNIVQEFNKIIDDNIVAGKSLNLQEIVVSLNVSLSTLNRTIKAKLGTTPNHHIMNRKLEKSRILINSGPSSSLKEIALVLGFNSLSYFSKCYKKKYGHFPSADNK